ncbi:MAG: serine/threonine protein kinase [bacterium]|nr:serine/threonine protein kinase [bacterium]
MTLARKKRLLDLLDQALEQDPGERAAFLDQECADDAALRDRVESLIDTAGDSEFLEKPVFDVHEEDASIGRSIGGYKLVRLLDRGGMGTVYLAEREDFEQRVALKVIRRGLDVDEMFVRRFENERQILARLQHRHIARLLDGGTTEDRLPYFVMEYVEGEPIDRYCRTHELSIRQRLELFRKVCSAVQVAHQNLVIHRDLKPGNILITANGEPKLLDFGIAKLLDEERPGSDLTALEGRGPMTPRYASPEQIRLDPITTASDVYSLGVLLYELLTGLDPYRIDTDRRDLLTQAILEREPDRPSTAVRRRAAENHTYVAPIEPRRLQRQLSGDLDSIVLKAMRKEPEARYGSAQQLSEDIHHHLTGKPVSARAGTWAYRAGKFVRRHKVSMFVIAAFFLLGLAFGVVVTILYQKADRERAEAQIARQEAVRERKKSEATRDFLKDLFKGAGPDQTKGENLSARELLERGRERLEANPEQDPEIKVELFGTLGEVFRNLGTYDQSRQMMELSLRTAQDLYDEPHPEIATRHANLGVILNDYQNYPAAENRFLRALEIKKQLEMPERLLLTTKANLATTLMHQGKFEDAERLYEEVLRKRIELSENPDQDKHVATTRRNLGALNYARGDFENAETYLIQALEARILVYEDESTYVASVLDLLGDVLAAQGKVEDAEKRYNQVLAMRKKLLGDEHLDVGVTKKNLANLLARREPDRAHELVTQALDVLRGTQTRRWQAADAESVLGLLLMDAENYEEAADYLVRGYEGLAEIRGANSYRTQRALDRVIELYDKWGKSEEAARYRALAGEG